MARVVVIGGRGQCGLAIGARLRDEGWEVSATASGPVPEVAEAAGIDWHLGAGVEVADGADVVVHTTAYTAADAAALVDLGDRIGSAVVLTSLSVYTDGAGRSLDGDEFPAWPVPIPEDQPTLEPGDSSYSTRKAAVESIVAEAAFPVTVVRPGAIHGPHSRHLREWWFVKRVLDRRPVVVLPFDGASIFQPTATANLAELVRLAALRPGRRTLNCGDIDPPTVAAIGAVVDEVMGGRTEQVTVPGPPPGPTVGNNPWEVPRPVVADMARAVDELGYRQPVDYATAIAPTLAWAVEACRGRPWQEVFTTLAGYPELFDYDAEDRWLADRDR